MSAHTPPDSRKDETNPKGEQRTGPSTGNARGNDLPSDSPTKRDSRQAEGGPDKPKSPEVPGRGLPGSEVSGSTGESSPEAPD